MKTEARKIAFIRIIFITIIILVLIVLCSALNSNNQASAATYPKYIDESSDYILQHVWLTSKYEFISYTNPYSGGYCTGAYIIKYGDSQSKTMVEWLPDDGEELSFAGKSDGVYYFNKRSYPSPHSVCTYTLGEKKLKKLKNTKDLNFIPFKKAQDYIFNIGGLSKNRYAIGVCFYPTDASAPYYIRVYDLKNKTYKTIGKAFDIVRDGKKLFWVKTSNYPYNKKTKILVKSSNLSGGNRKVLKRYKAGFLKDSYGRGEISKHYVKYVYMKVKDGISKTYTFKRKYRS